MSLEKKNRFVSSFNLGADLVTLGDLEVIASFPDESLNEQTEEEFESFFVKDDNFMNKDMFQRRIVGLTSFYETSKKDIDEFPEQLPTKIIKVKMSHHQFELYQQGREIEKRKKKSSTTD